MAVRRTSRKMVGTRRRAAYRCHGSLYSTSLSGSDRQENTDVKRNSAHRVMQVLLSQKAMRTQHSSNMKATTRSINVFFCYEYVLILLGKKYFDSRSVAETFFPASLGSSATKEKTLGLNKSSL